MKKAKHYQGFYLDEDVKLILESLYAEYKELDRKTTYSGIVNNLIRLSELSRGVSHARKDTV